jgi:hypothetical protein
MRMQTIVGRGGPWNHSLIRGGQHVLRNTRKQLAASALVVFVVHLPSVMSQPSRPRFRKFFKSLRHRVSSGSNRSSSPQPTESSQGPSPGPNPRPRSPLPAPAESSPAPHPDPSRSLHTVTALSSPLPNPYQLLLPSSPSPEHPALFSRTEKVKELGSTGWAALKAALKIVEKVSGALPPLQMAVGGLLVVIEHRCAYHFADDEDID